MFPGVWILGAQVRSGEFELLAGYQVDIGGVGCVSRKGQVWARNLGPSECVGETTRAEGMDGEEKETELTWGG